MHLDCNDVHVDVNIDIMLILKISGFSHNGYWRYAPFSVLISIWILMMSWLMSMVISIFFIVMLIMIAMMDELILKM